MKKRKIAVVTGTRAEYGILKPLMKKIKNSPDLRLQPIVSGMHLLKPYGLTIKEIKKDGFKIEKTVKMYEGKISPVYYGKALGKGIGGFTRAFWETGPDIVVVLGDRLEPLAATLAAATLRVPVAHIHGGDKTDSGHIDESIRHAIVRFAHIHLTPTKKCRERLLKWGEEDRRIHKVGALGLDSVLNSPKEKKDILFKKLRLDIRQKLILCLFHPVHLEAEKMGRQMRQIIEALKELKIQTVIIYPNNDAGTEGIIKEIKRAEKLPFVRVFQNLFHADYLNLLCRSDVLIGNSSSGIIEAPSLGLPVINIGSRNVGREHGENVLYVKAEKGEIIEALKKALYDRRFLDKVKRCRNPWGDGKTAGRIIKILNEIKINQRLLQKKITY